MVTIQMVGVDHNKAPLAVRESVSFTKGEAVHGLEQLMAGGGLSGCVLISTCNRTELWLSGWEGEQEEAVRLLCSLKGQDPSAFGPVCVGRRGEEAVRYLFELSCGLHSKVFGEDQIITQVKDALALARQAGAADTVLEKLFQGAVTAAKKVKTQLHLTAVSRSVAQKAADLLTERLGPLEGVPCLVIGNGEMGQLMARELVARGADVTMTLRQYKRGDVLIPAGCKIINYADRLEFLRLARVAVSATTSNHHTIKYEETRELLQDGKKRVLVDLAVPRDISPQLGELPGVELYDIDTLGGASMDEGSNQAVAQARQILAEGEEEFLSWHAFRALVPLVQRAGTLAGEDVAWRTRRLVDDLPLTGEERRELLEEIASAAGKVASRMLYGLREELDSDLWAPCVHGILHTLEGKENRP